MHRYIACFLAFIQLITPISAFNLPLNNIKDIVHPAKSRRGMVSVAEEYAARAGLEVLQEGGNAIDAAVTVAFVLAVTTPQAGNLGGGGFMMIHTEKNKKTYAIDYREKAPELAHKTLFLDENNQFDRSKTRFSALASGVPGTVAGLFLALETFGTISHKRALAPAIRLAEDGFIVNEQLYNDLQAAKDRMAKNPTAYKALYKDGIPYNPGETLVQKDLAWSLRQLSQFGRSAFYDGPIGEKLVSAMRKNGGLITEEDLDSYEAFIRKPVSGTYRGYKVFSMPPPSSGGAHLVQILNLIEPYPIRNWGHNSANTIHAMSEAMKLAYADRSVHLGDSDFIDVPLEGLTSKAYANDLRKSINLSKSTPSVQITPGIPQAYESNETNHFSIVDRYGNAVSNTYTLNFKFGSHVMVPGAGFLLNNQMDDFSAKAGEPNAYGLIGSSANAIQPNKRMLSSMTPTILLDKNDDLFLVTGTPGGSKIITTVTQIICNIIDHQMNIQEATNASRFHHQWIPNVIRIEEGISQDTQKLLTRRGHKIITGETMGAAQSILIKKGVLFGAVDPRSVGGVALGY